MSNKKHVRIHTVIKSIIELITLTQLSVLTNASTFKKRTLDSYGTSVYIALIKGSFFQLDSVIYGVRVNSEYDKESMRIESSLLIHNRTVKSAIDRAPTSAVRYRPSQAIHCTNNL